MLCAISLFFVLESLGCSLFISTYLPPTLVALAIALLEHYIPYRVEWAPRKEELRNDLLFMFCVQIAVPSCLAFLLAYALATNLGADTKFLSILWPSKLPVFFQALLMLLISDFLRYWIHRFNHNSELLWRLHAVHHSPDKLYWINVGRFHPIEKAIQFLADSLPFILAGVTPEVLGLYFLVYSAHGFFQHCNVNLKLGRLNYIVSGPELHRWHHSRKVKESNNNYGNNFIIWDLLFGTRFFPKDLEVGRLGVLSESYPKDFIAQLKAPFTNDGPAK
jgi:sterol desaturase/sphingolipid hydroxylase (fatty acid hydroxylase superfamily)